jgi:two-component SAPR family response regulator
MLQMLHAALVLICEDEPFVALDLAISVEAAGGNVLGPLARVSEAMTLLGERIVDAAILDVNLKDGDVSPVALRLLELNVPFVMQSGVGLPDDLKTSDPALPLFMKPVQSTVLIQNLAERLGRT